MCAVSLGMFIGYLGARPGTTDVCRRSRLVYQCNIKVAIWSVVAGISLMVAVLTKKLLEKTCVVGSWVLGKVLFGEGIHGENHVSDSFVVEARLLRVWRFVVVATVALHRHSTSTTLDQFLCVETETFIHLLWVSIIKCIVCNMHRTVVSDGMSRLWI